MMFERAFVIVSIIVQLSSAQNDGYCLSSDYEPYLLFGTKTSYEFVRSKESNQHIVQGCFPIQFWSLNRHGARFPTESDIDGLADLAKTRNFIIDNYEVRRTSPDHGRLCSQDLENLKTWEWHHISKSNASHLTYQGYGDLKYLAKRWQSKFPEILPATYSPRNYLFRYTNTSRTKDSFMAFADGLFGKDALASIRMPEPEIKDTVLRVNKFCKTWINDVQNNNATIEQLNNFKLKEEYRTMIKNVSAHFGFKYDLEERKIKNIYDMCRYEKAWEINKLSPWCSAFNSDQLRLLEYVEDLKTYYETGYGNELNKKLGCMPVKDMMDKFTQMIERPDQDQPKAIVYFTHSKTMLSLLTALGIAKDSVPLLADNYHTPNVQRRHWRTSHIDPFTSNLAAILYSCSQGEKHQVMFFLNERPVEFDDCKVGLCSWEKVKQKYANVVKQCNLKFCDNNKASIITTNTLTFYLSIFLIIVRKISD